MKQDVQAKVVAVSGTYMGVVEREERTGDDSAATLVLLHGFTGSAAGWGRLLHELPGRRLIALDLPGHGASDAPRDPGFYSLEQCSENVVAALRVLGVAPGEAVLLGYSLGGRIALYSAFSGFFRAVILESASPGLADAEEREQRRASDETLAQRIEREGVPAFVSYWENIPLFASQAVLPAEVRAAQRRLRLLNQAHGLANSLRGAGTGTQPPLHEQLARLNMPVMLVTGELDTKFCAIGRDMAQCLPHAELYIVPGAGHAVHLERPEIFSGLVRQFCASLI
ncbi:MAG: 2-succinyl-6-hydroxy-2,4-cyclohexadiene-1-carboxylate synthase [Ktedonobacteraceae bacterium]|nr:2-succinyl-6-hydroxy-2,4-cyclohexadiene-1-carboxylate synthase [Ktedonobacteraceae bacterium]MBO0791035.1 2-succinyl-6-hydroxy-2,4-cyclohexadiene-1-carboxylate synthase [Ktedonobacteraceae bacterium]